MATRIFCDFVSTEQHEASLKVAVWKEKSLNTIETMTTRDSCLIHVGDIVEGLKEWTENANFDSIRIHKIGA